LTASFSFLLGLALNQLILLFVHRIRPYDGGVTNFLIDRSADFSFPSHHATTSSSMDCAQAAQFVDRTTLPTGPNGQPIAPGIGSA